MREGLIWYAIIMKLKEERFSLERLYSTRPLFTVQSACGRLQYLKFRFLGSDGGTVMKSNYCVPNMCPVCLSLRRMEKGDFHWMYFCDILYLGFFKHFSSLLNVA
jgi:hypothetical protein